MPPIGCKGIDHSGFKRYFTERLFQPKLVIRRFSFTVDRIDGGKELSFSLFPSHFFSLLWVYTVLPLHVDVYRNRLK